MTSAAKTELQVGRLSPEDADRFASMFRPAWELDDAPFASGTKLSAAEMDALAGSAGVNADVQAAQAGPRFPPARTDTRPEPNTVVIAADPEPLRAAPIAAAAPAVAPAVPQQAQQAQKQRKSKPPAQPVAPVAAARRNAPTAVDTGDFAPPKKSNLGLVIGAAVVGLLLVGGLVFKFALSSDTPKPAPITSQPTQTTEERHIPPPPPDTDTATAQTAAPTATATQTTAPTATQTTAPTATATQAAATTAATAQATARPTATATHTSAAAAMTGTTRPTSTATGKTNTGKGTGGIVRDTPF